MPRYGRTSKARLATAHPILQDVFNAVIERVDCSVIWGRRGYVDQMEAYVEEFSKARFGQSPHNYEVSLAVDVVPYPSGWKDEKILADFAIYVKGVAHGLGYLNMIDWGGDFKSINDMAHWELREWRTLRRDAKLFEG